MSFISDNTVGASAPVMAALAAASSDSAAAYGRDDWTKRVEARLGEIFERPVAAFLVASGTAANALSLACLVRPWGAVLTHRESHVAGSECGAPEFFSDGAKLVGLPGTGNKIEPVSVTQALAALPASALHRVQPQALSITQATECGTVYRPEEIAALKEVIAPRGLKLHMDGARFANALVRLGCTPAEITWKAGVDVLSFGGTKNGAWAAEAVVFFDPAAAEELQWRRKRSGHTLSKGRLIGAQFEALLTDNHWLDLARHANAMAERLAQAVAAGSSARFAWPCESNQLFLILPEALRRRLDAAGVGYLPWKEGALPPGETIAEGETLARFVTSFATRPEDVDRLASLLAS